jgi:cellulose synthase/poly-beta-1,6-N-acetylglucosamine synthase-like glycosyltransferase
LQLRPPQTRFAVLVPAHDEEEVLADTLCSLLALDYPRDRFMIHLIADNCTDSTAEIGRSFGVTVHERFDAEHPGKGQALHWLLDDLMQDTSTDAFAFVDADTTVDADFLKMMDRRLAGGEVALQASYRVKDAGSHPLVGLRALAFALIHDLRASGKARLGLSAGLWGNGMVMARSCLERVPWGAFTAVEDAEQHLRLLLNGYKVTYVPETHVYGHMPSSFRSARNQQRRWEGGKLTLARRYSRALLWQSLRSRGAASIAALIELLLPPLSVQVLGAVALTIAAWLIGGTTAGLVATACLGVLALYIGRGFMTSSLPRSTLWSLSYAPVYVAWKAWLFASELPRREPAWMRTARRR